MYTDVSRVVTAALDEYFRPVAPLSDRTLCVGDVWGSEVNALFNLFLEHSSRKT